MFYVFSLVVLSVFLCRLAELFNSPFFQTGAVEQKQQLPTQQQQQTEIKSQADAETDVADVVLMPTCIVHEAGETDTNSASLPPLSVALARIRDRSVRVLYAVVIGLSAHRVCVRVWFEVIVT